MKPIYIRVLKHSSKYGIMIGVFCSLASYSDGEVKTLFDSTVLALISQQDTLDIRLNHKSSSKI